MKQPINLKTEASVEEAGQLDPTVFSEALYQVGFRLGSGVPCSWLAPLTNALLEHPRMRYVPAAQEGDAVAIAAGADLGGQRALVAIQNSGLTNVGSPLTSYNFPFRRGVLLLVSLRGEPGVPDEPQHELLGQITAEQLTLWRIPYDYLAADGDEALEQLAVAGAHLDRGQSYALIVKKDTFSAHPLRIKNKDRQTAGEHISGGGLNELPSRRAALQKLLPHRDTGSVLLATTGYTGRELFELGDAPNQLMMVGSMGCVSSLGLGLALAQPHKRIIAIDGDGALLMRLGSLATNAWQAPKNLLHILLDNQQHESTGGQPTAASVVAFPEVAAAVGYPRVVWAHTLDQFADELAVWHQTPQLTFLYLPIRAGVPEKLGRPTITPAEVAARLRNHLHEHSN